MNLMRWRRLRTTRAAHVDYPFDELLLDTRDPISTQQADCCVANAAYRVRLPAAAARARPAELLLCGHHYRRAQAALNRIHAEVFGPDNRLVGTMVHTMAGR